MSDRIDEILEVLREVSTSPIDRAGASSFRARRIAAVKRVAERRGIARETVQDKFGRQLQPDVMTAATFDRLCVEWLQGNSPTLRQILTRHAIDQADEIRIERFFDNKAAGREALRVRDQY